MIIDARLVRARAPLGRRDFGAGACNLLARMSDLGIAFASNGPAAPGDRLAQDPALYERCN